MNNSIYKATLVLGLFSLMTNSGYSQVGIGTSNPHESAIYEVKSTSQGFLLPRLTTEERDSISNPIPGLFIYNTEKENIQIYKQSQTFTELEGWYDSKCETTINEPLTGFPPGFVLDFADLNNNGKLYSGQGGAGNAFTQFTANGSSIGSVGPLPTDLNLVVAGGAQESPAAWTGWLDFTDGNNSNETSADHVVFKSKGVLNAYNASTFLARNRKHGTNSGDKLSIDFTDAGGADYDEKDFDMFIVAKFDELPTVDNESFFSTGTATSHCIQLGAGSGAQGKKYYNINFASKSKIGSDAIYLKRVLVDDQFHRFRIHYDNKTNANNSVVKFYIDGKLVASESGTDVDEVSIKGFWFFNNRNQTSYPVSSISFLGFYTQELSAQNFADLDAYLECRFN